MKGPSKVRSNCAVCGPYVVDAKTTETSPGHLEVEIPTDFIARHNEEETHIFLTEAKRALFEATHYRQSA